MQKKVVAAAVTDALARRKTSEEAALAVAVGAAVQSEKVRGRTEALVEARALEARVRAEAGAKAEAKLALAREETERDVMRRIKPELQKQERGVGTHSDSTL